MNLPPVPGPIISGSGDPGDLRGQLTAPWRSWFSALFNFVTAYFIAPGVRVNIGNGSPNGAVVGSPGDLYVSSAGGAGTTLYVKESGVATKTGWVGK